MTKSITLPTERQAANTSQSTAIEQSRAVTEVQAAVTVAQAVPRDITRAKQQIAEACDHYGLAERAFYSVPKRGTGPSVHLAREIARCFGNFQSGIKELRRDDISQTSELLAWAWDVENNTRSERTMIVPHAKMAQGQRKVLNDLTDIINNNNSYAARALREVIFNELPVGLVEYAKGLCRQRLERGENPEQSLDERIANMVAAYERAGIRIGQLEARVGLPRAEWAEQQIADLGVVWKSMREGSTSLSEEFGEERLSAGNLRPLANTEPPAPTEQGGAS